MGVPKPTKGTETKEIDVRDPPPTQPAAVDEWRKAERRSELEDESTPVRGPSANASTGRVVTERETVTDDAADADGTDRNPALTTDDPDAT